MRESDQKIRCSYCKEDLKEKQWSSVWLNNIHYKTSDCDCGNKNRITVQFEGSGDDKFNGIRKWRTKISKKKPEPAKITTLDHKIKLAESK